MTIPLSSSHSIMVPRCGLHTYSFFVSLFLCAAARVGLDLRPPWRSVRPGNPVTLPGGQTLCSIGSPSYWPSCSSFSRSQVAGP